MVEATGCLSPISFLSFPKNLRSYCIIWNADVISGTLAAISKHEGKGSQARRWQSLDPNNMEQLPLQPALPYPDCLSFRGKESSSLLKPFYHWTLYYIQAALITTDSNDNFRKSFQLIYSRIPTCFFLVYPWLTTTYQRKLSSERLSVLAKMQQEQNLGIL